jgi:hypothetical protein
VTIGDAVHHRRGASGVLRVQLRDHLVASLGIPASRRRLLRTRDGLPHLRAPGALRVSSAGPAGRRNIRYLGASGCRDSCSSSPAPTCSSDSPCSTLSSRPRSTRRTEAQRARPAPAGHLPHRHRAAADVPDLRCRARSWPQPASLSARTPGSHLVWLICRRPADARGRPRAAHLDITDDQLWKPGTWEPSLQALYAWGRKCPPPCWRRDDLAELMAGSDP